MRALVTGATGYIGSNLVRRLLGQGWEVHIVARDDSDLTILSPLRDGFTVHLHDGTAQGMDRVFAHAKPEIVFHLASLFLGQHGTDQVDALIASNVLFPTQLAEAMAAHGTKWLINTGTSWQHHHDQTYNPVNLYAATKQAFEDILQFYVETADLKATTLALFDTYGPSDPRNKLISLLWKTGLSQQPMAMSPGEQLIDLVYIDDVIDAFMLASELVQTQAQGHCRYGVSSGNPLPLRDLAAAFSSATGLPLPITWGGRAYRPREVMTPWTSYRGLPGWQAQVSFADGILRTRPLQGAGH